MKKRTLANGSWVAFSLPAIFCVLAFMLYPVIYSLVLSFYSHQGLMSTFVGIGNFKRLLSDGIFWSSLFNTLLFLAIQVPIMLLLGLFFAYLLQTDGLKGRGFFRMALFLPCITSPVAYSIVFRTMFQFDGLINGILQSLHLIDNPISWLTEKNFARVVIIIALCWRWTGYNTMYYIAGLQNVSKDTLEAARIDGANAFQEFFHIVVPQLKQVIVFTSITSTIGTLQLFDEVVNLTSGGPANATLTVALYTYQQSFLNANNFGYSATISWVVVFMIAGLSLVQLRLTREAS